MNSVNAMPTSRFQSTASKNLAFSKKRYGCQSFTGHRICPLPCGRITGLTSFRARSPWLRSVRFNPPACPLEQPVNAFYFTIFRYALRRIQSNRAHQAVVACSAIGAFHPRQRLLRVFHVKHSIKPSILPKSFHHRRQGFNGP